MDKDQTGFITPEELKEALNLEHFDFNEEQIDSILKQVDIEPNGKINYEMINLSNDSYKIKCKSMFLHSTIGS